MSHGWTQERREKQPKAIQRWKPWEDRSWNEVRLYPA